MNPKDLLDFDKVAELEKQVEQMETLGNKETIKKNIPKDNAYDLNRMNTDYDGVGMSEDDAIEREHDREVEKEEQAVERDLERQENDFGGGAYY